MINGNLDIFSAPVRTITAKVELFNNSTNALTTFTTNGDLVSANIERLGASKFFGYGISQKAVVKVRDKERKYNIPNNAYFKISFNETSAFPSLYVSEVARDENTNGLTITMLDKLADAANHTINELELGSYTIGELAQAIAAFLGLGVALEALNEFGLYFEDGANFSGSESLREALNAIAEATQTVYYINYENKLVFKRLAQSDAPVYTIPKAQYFTLDSKTDKQLTTIGSVTELGDNVAASTGAEGEAQYIRNNPFWNLREDVGDLVEQALEAVGGLTINQFNVKWRGNYLLEPTDKISIITKDGNAVYSYLLNDTINYNGGFSQTTAWEYGAEEKAHTNSSTLGEVLNETYAKVDKANKQVDIAVSTANANASAISALQVNANSINATVADLQKATDAATGNIETLTQKVSAQITPEQLQLAITTEMEKGAKKVETSTGFTFNELGLTVSKTNSEISTTITEDGMQVLKGSQEVLTANNEGVKAEDLHATTFLIIGKNSRLEDMGARTACFWIGG